MMGRFFYQCVVIVFLTYLYKSAFWRTNVRNYSKISFNVYILSKETSPATQRAAGELCGGKVLILSSLGRKIDHDEGAIILLEGT